MRIRFPLQLALAGSLLLCALLPGGSTAAQDGVRLTISGVDSTGFPNVVAQLTVTDVAGLPVQGLPPTAFAISDNGHVIDDFTLNEIAVPDRQLNVVLVMDSSESMQAAMADTQAAATAFVESLSDDDRIGLVTLTDEGATPATLTNDRESVKAAIANTTATGQTAIYDGLVTAVQMLKNLPVGHKAIILIADGYDTSSSYTFDQAVGEAIRWSIPVFPVGFGWVDQESMEKVAELTGGYAQIKPDATSLQPAFDTVLQTLRQQYVIEFVSPFPADNTEHTLSITAQYEGIQLLQSATFTAHPAAVSFELDGLTDGQELAGIVNLRPAPSSLLSPGSVEEVEYLLDGQPLHTVFSEPFEHVWDTTAIAEGPHTLTAIATDVSGNVGTVELQIVVRPPIVIRWVSPVEAQDVSHSIPLSIEATTISAIAQVQYYVDDILLETVAGEPFEVEWRLDGVQPGTHRLRAVVTDSNGLTSEAVISVNVLLRSGTTVLVAALVAGIALGAVVIPLALRRRRRISRQNSLLDDTDQPALMLVELQGRQPGQKWPLDKPVLRIGRKQEVNDVPVAGLSASREHAVILRRDAQYVLQNLNPQNQTNINDEAVYQEHVLRTGDIIQIGESVFRVGAASEESDGLRV